MQTIFENASRKARHSFNLADAVGKAGLSTIGAIEAALLEIARPAFAGAYALPDYTGRPSDAEAIRYARSLIVNGPAAGSVAYVLPNAEYGLAVDVGIAVGGETYIVTCWFENGKIYGEW